MLTVFSLRFLFDAVSNVIRSAGEVLLPVGAIVGLLLGLLGFRLYKFTLFIFGFALGALIGLVIGFLAGDLGSAFAVALIAGLISGLLALFLEALGVFLMGAAFGGLLGLILAAASNDATATVTVALVLAILGGVVALFVRKVFVIVATSVLGALLVTGAVVAALRTSLGSPPVPILLMLVLFAAFIVVQFATTRHIVRGAPRSDLIEPPIANPTQQRAESKEPLPKENERPHQTRARASVRKILFVALPVAIIAFAGYSIYSNYASKRSVTTNNKITVEEALDSIGQEFSKNPRLIDDLARSMTA